jgi:GntR family transcriptional regulator, arabinose operon transcriptional repressor
VRDLSHACNVSPYDSKSVRISGARQPQRAGYLVTDHVVAQGARRLAFVGLAHGASSVDARIGGVREALQARGAAVETLSAHWLDPTDALAVRDLMERVRPDTLVAANDRTAARLMRTLIDLGYAIPETVRLVGFDDVRYAELLPVPLTTVRQPCEEIGTAAMAAMLERLAHPTLPPREILLHGTLVVRRSCGHDRRGLPDSTGGRTP